MSANNCNFGTIRRLAANVNIENHLTRLLFSHDCVVVPGFGGFICDYAPATVDADRHIVYPPSKKIAFNAGLKKNDGLLASYIASAEKIEYDDAFKKVREFVDTCSQALEAKQHVVIPGLGMLYRDGGSHLHFRGDASQNFLLDSFGLPPLQLNPAGRIRPLHRKRPVEKPARVEIPVQERTAARRTLPVATLIPIAALLALMLMVPALVPRVEPLVSSLSPVSAGHPAEGHRPASGAEQVIFLPGERGSLLEKAVKDEQSLAGPAMPAAETDSSVATDGAGTAWPVEEASSPEMATTGMARSAAETYHVIVGCFRVVENATQFAAQLQKAGYPAHIAGLNNAGLTMISASSHATLQDAEAALDEVRGSIIRSAWIHHSTR